jgi:hypothetical protein
MIAYFADCDDPVEVAALDHSDTWILNVTMMLDTFEDQGQRFVAFPDQFGNTVAIKRGPAPITDPMKRVVREWDKCRFCGQPSFYFWWV